MKKTARNMQKFLLAAGLIWLPLQSFAAESVENAPNFLFNPGWELGDGPWSALFGNGKTELVSPGHSGSKCIRLTNTEKNGKAQNTVYRQMLPRLETWGQTCTVSVWAKGKGRIAIGMHFICDKKQGKQSFKRVISKTFALTDQWQKYEQSFRVTEPAVFQMGAVFELYDKDASALLDDASFSITENNKEITADSMHLSLKENDVPSVVFHRKNGSGKLCAFNGEKQEELPVAQDGTCKVQGTPQTNCVAVFDPDSASAAQVLVDYLPQEQWNRMDAAAKKISLKNPMRILFLGDSLSDFKRGNNYADKLVFWLNKYNSGKISFYNAGISGDWISRVPKRFKGDSDAYGLFRYSRIQRESFDVIFLFLGHNDTRLSYNAKTGKSTTLVAPEQGEKDWKETISLLKQMQPKAKIVILLPVSMDHERSCQLTENARKAGRGYTVFGTPEKLDEYAAYVRKVAAENQLCVIDLLTASRSAGAKAAFYHSGDGVHLTQAGEDFVAEQLLENWSKIFSAGK